MPAAFPPSSRTFIPPSWTGATPPRHAWTSVRKKALAEKVPIVPMSPGRSFKFGAGIEVLSPPADYAPRDAAGNDSLVLRITYGQRWFLLASDMKKPWSRGLWREGFHSAPAFSR
jgi:beta-lactamase superfamily II metal-dependent hydrolase